MAHRVTRIALDTPQHQRECDRDRAVTQPGEHASRAGQQHGAASLTAVAAQLQHGHRGRHLRSCRPQLQPLAKAVPVQPEMSASWGACGATPDAPRRAHRVDRGRLLCPRLDRNVEVDDVKGAPLLFQWCRSTTGELCWRTPPSANSRARLCADAPPPAQPVYAVAASIAQFVVAATFEGRQNARRGVKMGLRGIGTRDCGWTEAGMKNRCPSCRELSLPLWSKWVATRARPARCARCGAAAYVGGWYRLMAAILGSLLGLAIFPGLLLWSRHIDIIGGLLIAGLVAVLLAPAPMNSAPDP